MTLGKGNGRIAHFFIHLGAVFLGAVLFAAAFPNVFVENGIPLLAWIAYIPVFWLINRVSLGSSFLWGALYGYTAYGLFNYWLSVFHPLAGLIVGTIYLVYFMFLFALLKMAVLLFKKRGYLVQFLMWMGFEYLRTQGFLGYSYGITGYSQWKVLPLIQIADIFGVWGVSALVVFPSVYIAEGIKEAGIEFGKIPGFLKTFAKKEWVSLCMWIAALLFALIYGFISPIRYEDAQYVKIALIQHNTDPWLGGIEEYRKNFEVLRRLSDEALQNEPKPDMVVWSETAFVPRIYWHKTYRDDHESYVLVKELLDYLAVQEVPFVIGNDDARKDAGKNPYDDHRIDYNAVMLFERGEITKLYRKLHLVPFTEHFPYEKQFPLIYQALKNADTHFWEKGNEAAVFEYKGLKFSSPICFEDTFGYLSRNFVRNGAELIVNLSNDAWSKSLPAQNQHLSMAVFRSVENRRSMVRSTSSGQTCGIDPNGKVLAMAPPFTESYLTVSVPVVRPSTIYTEYGDFLPLICISMLILILIIGFILFIIRLIKTGMYGKDKI
ncbi:MAG: apolipoprotein N-acyltransferase [Treponema sp.]|jgi:apolipoprotein N-acyltransferase|nr:apolipoprotein N-acyltransferase [Treponema sp.]